jgi:hypothetical protein
MGEGDSANSLRFRGPINAENAAALVLSLTPKSTQYKTKWAVEVFRSWQMARVIKFPVVEVGNLFKDYETHTVETVRTDERCFAQ